MQTHEKISHVRETFAAHIAADPFFTNEKMTIPVLTERKGDIESMLQTALGSLGLAVVVVAANTDGGKWVGDRYELRVIITAQISEDFLMNKSAHDKAGVPYRDAQQAGTAALLAVGRKPNGLDAPGAAHRPRLNEFELAADPLQLVPDAPVLTYHLTAFTTVRL
ncbi:hypothetical protein OpiT1DRAFT_03968 [Opitutaceae bacterium TAV1]|nr:hypothetical protein OpiT1DRAFT_03968 [Opitutaceae bacterium TAV1]